VDKAPSTLKRRRFLRYCRVEKEVSSYVLWGSRGSAIARGRQNKNHYRKLWKKRRLPFDLHGRK